ncbi:Nitroreductase [Pasteurella testudinis DSM 23072]|uniref:Nitroreductase n=1 Tax=Pasteurella testudinis DSM 23072 TaxID=1122938 RepID=A0A1W1UM09_9PAST|nr:nitroreductase [Pasteurella testudinis]SMB81831.1 Nitroreductase [Pasteurella testudinis DSM 23072]SUB50299.1 NADH dehydrogenase [Pasteurella testudinis]
MNQITPILDFSTTAQTRQSIRDFLPEPLSRAEIEAVLEDARRAPSAVNAQPWLMHMVSGEMLQKLSDVLVEKFRHGTPNPDFIYEQSAFADVYETRMRESYKILYEAFNVSRADKKGRKNFAEENVRFYGAPHAAFFFAPDITDNVNVAMDVGMLVQTFMLALTARGFGSVPQLLLAFYPDVVRELLAVPKGYKLLVGVSFGRPNPASPANNIRIPRAPLGETVVFHD